MEFKCKSIKQYLKSCNLDEIHLPDIKMYLFEDVYPPKLDSFLIAEELMKVVKENHKVLDVGTGSGILAILAAKNGALTVATDIHKDSIRCAKYNASLNNVKLDVIVCNLFEGIKDRELFDVIISNMPSLPTPPDEKHNEFITRTVDAGPDGRRYLDPLMNQIPNYLKEGGYFLTVHSNFANIDKTKNKLKDLGFRVRLKVYEYPIGKISGQRIDYFLKYLPENCHPIKKKGKWYQRIAVFIGERG